MARRDARFILQEVKRVAKRRLNERQIAAIELLADFGQHLTYEEIAKRVGVDVSTLRRWRTKDQAFIDELIAQCKRNAVKDLPRVMEAVPDIIIKSENAAMFRTWLQTIGALTEKVEVTNKSDTSNADLDAIKAEIERMRKERDRL